jgi:hypothetical protein
MSDLQNGNAKMDKSMTTYNIAYLEYNDCMKTDSSCNSLSKSSSNSGSGSGSEKCHYEKERLYKAYRGISTDIDDLSTIVKNKNIRGNRDEDEVIIQPNDKIHLGDKYRPQLSGRTFDYLSFCWIIVTTMVLYLILVKF